MYRFILKKNIYMTIVNSINKLSQKHNVSALETEEKFESFDLYLFFCRICLNNI